MRAFVVPGPPRRQHRSGRRGYPQNTARLIGRPAGPGTVGRMDFTTALAILEDARLALVDPDRDPRSAALDARVSLRDADQLLADLMAA